MTDLRTAAQQALEALEKLIVGSEYEEAVEAERAIYALRAALAEPVQEPVAWMVYTLDGKSVCVTDNPADFIEWRSLPLYTAPPQRLPLTEEEIGKIILETEITLKNYCDVDLQTEFARRIERAHGITP